jgi:protein-L-isoaspartate(D-aspartate) O-methyltransferase
MSEAKEHRFFFSELMAANCGEAGYERQLAAAFAETPREDFLGRGPWKVFVKGRYLETPTADPAFLYQDVLIGIAPERAINNGEPTLHAICLGALRVKEGETVVHVGAGTGYYTAILSRLAGATGIVVAYEIERDLAERAMRNLSKHKNVKVEARSGCNGSIPECDAIYVNAGATGPAQGWLDALRTNGRLLFPLAPDGADGKPGAGGMLLLTKITADSFHARFVCPAMFIPCLGARNSETAAKLGEAFRRGDAGRVRALYRNRPKDETYWCGGDDWWLSTREAT